MSAQIPRYIKRFLITAVIEAILVLCLISAARLLYVRKAVENARKLTAESQYDRVIKELRLAQAWAPAYPAFAETTRGLLAEAHTRAGNQPDSPANEPRSFTSGISPLEKSLIIPDRVVNWLFGMINKQANELPPQIAQPTTPSYSPDPAETASRPSITVSDPPYRGASGNSFSDTQHAPQNDSPSNPTESSPASDPTQEPAAVAARPRNPNAMWGASIRTETDIFGQDGKKLRSVPAGSLVSVHSTKQTPKGEVVLCTVGSSQGRFDNVYIRRHDLELYEGQAIVESTKEQRELVSKRARLLAQIETRTKAMETAAKGKNPYQEQYRSVLVEYKGINDQSVALNKEWGSSTGSKRVDLGNKLRLLKNEQANLMPRYQDIKQKKEAWEQNNSATKPDPDTDPQIQNLKEQLRAVDAQLRNS
ncbi:MAG TPA: hypothetical protein DCS43_11120 [Verrucomicrobia bacterium]|nr:hypothetical protein [Verrucomicrobiota bacterium]